MIAYYNNFCPSVPVAQDNYLPNSFFPYYNTYYRVELTYYYSIYYTNYIVYPVAYQFGPTAFSTTFPSFSRSNSELINKYVSLEENPYFYYYHSMLTTHEEEEKFRSDKVQDWFDTFYKYTNNKKKAAEVLERFLKLMHKNNYMGEMPLKVIDVGCCANDFPLQLMKIFSSVTEGKFFYFGIDKNFTAVENIKREEKALEQKQEKNLLSDFYVCDYFTLSELEYSKISLHTVNGRQYFGDHFNFDLAIYANIAYYADNINAFVKNSMASLSDDGFVVFIHESEKSLPKQKSAQCRAPVKSDTAALLIQALQENSISYYVVQVEGKISFPLDMEPILKKKDTDLSENEKVQKTIIEYVCQLPLETLYDKNLLQTCLEDLVHIPTRSDVVFATHNTATDWKKVFETNNNPIIETALINPIEQSSQY